MNSHLHGRMSTEASITKRTVTPDRNGRAKRGTRSRSLAILLAAWGALPLIACAEMTLNLEEASSIYNTVLYHRYLKAIDQPVQAVCYVDFKVPGSMGCTGATARKGTSGFDLRNAAKRSATKQCKNQGGKRCRLFWRNGELQSDRLTGELRARFETLLAYPGTHETKSSPLPEGTSIGKLARDNLPGVRDGLEAHRISRDGHNPHTAICGNEAGYWSMFLAEGEGVKSDDIQNLCAVKCNGLAHDWVIKEYPGFGGPCYVIFANGKFASEAAEAALIGED